MLTKEEEYRRVASLKYLIPKIGSKREVERFKELLEKHKEIEVLRERIKEKEFNGLKSIEFIRMYINTENSKEWDKLISEEELSEIDKIVDRLYRRYLEYGVMKLK